MIKLRDILKESISGRRLIIFDFDDTLATSEAYIYITKADGTKLTMDPAEYAKYEEEPGDKFDFRDFNSRLKNPTIIDRNMKMLKKALGNPQNKVTVLTARGLGYPLKHFFKNQIGIDPYVVTTASSDPNTKARWIENHLKKGYKYVFFMDDSQKNIDAVAKLRPKYPEAVIRLYKA